jgi:signal transduction histidine kinase
MWILSAHQPRQTLRQSRSQLESLVYERTAKLQNLSQQLLRVQDEERRKVARDLHDSTGQTLTALKISVALLQRKMENDKQACDELSGIARLADEALQEIRTTSYLLHPPMLDETGFSSAAQWYIEGFAKRSGLKVRMDFAPAGERLRDTVEIVLFRVLQESLTNVHRHSGTTDVDICYRRDAQAVFLEVRDYGCGMTAGRSSQPGPPVKDSGVGLAGMRERLNELNGILEIEPANPGTRLRAIVPLYPEPYQLAPAAYVAEGPLRFVGINQAAQNHAS